jgi:hypothetical protein
VLEGEITRDEFAAQIDDLIDDSDRADLIAENELSMAQSDAAMEAWRESGVVAGKQALLSSEHDDDGICDDNADAGVIGIDEDFPSGDDTSPFHVGCVCDVIAVIDEGDEE